MTKAVEKSKTQASVAVSFNSLHDYITFAVLIVLIVGSLAALYIYDRQAHVYGGWATQFYNFLLN